MAQFFEETIKTYSGLSTDTKPTLTAGNNVPNGSRWREVDTSRIFYFNEGDDSWYELNGVDHPISTNGDFVYHKDICIPESDMGDFSGDVSDLLCDIRSVITNTTSDNPKNIDFAFNRTILTNVISIGTYSGNFSNVKLSLILPDDSEIDIIDESADNTKYTYRTFNLPLNLGFHKLRIYFYTADTVSLSYLIIPKYQYRITRLQAVKPDDTVTDIHATAGSNLKVSLEEIESGISTNSNSQLNVSPFIVDEYTNYTHILGDNIFKGAIISIPSEHHEIHCGDSYTAHHVEDLTNGATHDYIIIVPDWGSVSGSDSGSNQSIKIAHLVGDLSGEAETSFWFYESPTVTDNGNALNVRNRNRNSSNTDYLSIYEGATISAVGTELEHGKYGAGKLAGGGVNRTDEWVLANNTTYLLRVTNDTTSNNYHTIRFQYYVHPGI